MKLAFNNAMFHNCFKNDAPGRKAAFRTVLKHTILKSSKNDIELLVVVATFLADSNIK